MMEKNLKVRVQCEVTDKGTVKCNLVDLRDEERFCNIEIYSNGKFLIKDTTDPDMCVNFVKKYGEALKRVAPGGKVFSFEVSSGKIQKITTLEQQ